MKFSKETFLESLPLVLAQDADMRSLAEVIAGLYADDFGRLAKLLIFPAVDTLDEGIIDALAYDFKADWWDDNATISEKRETLKAIWATHRLAGTKEGVEKSIGAIYPGATVSEWFEYGGEPYHFRLSVPISADTELAAGDLRGDAYKDRVFWLLAYFKNLRSVPDEIDFIRTLPMTARLAVKGFGESGLSITPLPEILPALAFDAAVWVSTAAAQWHETRIGNDETPFGQLVVWELDGGEELAIWQDVPQRGGHELRVYEEDDEIVLEGEGITVEEDENGITINIQGG